MKILELSKQVFKNTSQIFQEKICRCGVNKKHLPENIKLKAQPVTDVFESNIKLSDLKLGYEINKGNEASVYEILGHPDLIAKVSYASSFQPQALSYKNSDIVRNIIAGTNDFSVIIMKRISGTPLYGKNWSQDHSPNPEEYFAQLEELKQIPDEAFIKYYNDLKELRKKDYEFDTVNPNNILYDSTKQRFNLVDIEQYPEDQNVTVVDFYPFIDGARVGDLYHKSSSTLRKALTNETRIFFDRIENIGNKLGVDLSNRDYIPDHNYIPCRFLDLE